MRGCAVAAIVLMVASFASAIAAAAFGRTVSDGRTDIALRVRP